MIPQFPVVLDDRWFRGVIYGVVMADLWVAAQGGDRGRWSGEYDGWRSQFLRIARAEAIGRGGSASVGAEGLTRLAQGSQSGLLLLVLPVLLVQANPYGHQSCHWQAWATGLGRSDDGRALIDQAFQMVCAAMAGRPPSLGCPQGGPLATIQGLLNASQGDFVLALRLAHQGAGDPLLLRGLGAVAMIQGGWNALPVALRHGGLESVALGQRWDGLDEEGLHQLTLALYDRWRGRCPGSFPQDRPSV